MAEKTYQAGVKDYRATYWTPNYVPLDTDILACFKIVAQAGVPTGRLDEMEVLEKNAWTHKLILIDGEAGVGKTRLAEEFACSSQSVVLIGQGRELEHNIPYHPITEALRGLMRTPSWQGSLSRIRKQLPKVWLAEVSRLLPELATDLTGPWLAGQTQEESRLWEGIHQFFLAIAQIKPIILIMDDLEWADLSTLGLLGYLVRHSSPEPISTGHWWPSQRRVTTHRKSERLRFAPRCWRSFVMACPGRRLTWHRPRHLGLTYQMNS